MLLLATVARIFYRHTIQVKKQQLADAAAGKTPDDQAGRPSGLSVAEQPKKVPYHTLYIDEDYIQTAAAPLPQIIIRDVDCMAADHRPSIQSTAASTDELIRKSTQSTVGDDEC